MTKQLEDICQLVTDLCERVKADLRARNVATTAPQGVLLYWFAKAAKTYRAIILLAREGYWQDATTLTRTLLEIVFQAKYLNDDPEPRAALFTSDDKRQRLKILKVADKYNDPADSDIKDYIDQLGPDTISEQKWRNWWGKDKTIKNLADLALLSRAYEMEYGFMSLFVHSAAPATSSYIYGTGDTVNVDWKANQPHPENEGISSTIVASAGTYMMDIISVLGAVYNFEYETELQTLEGAVEEFKKS